MRTVLFTGDIFRLQARGGITRYVVETARRLERPVEIVAGLHESRELHGLANTVRVAIRAPVLLRRLRVTALVNAWIDAGRLRRRRPVILHPTYYRDPGSLPAGAPLVLTVHDLTHERFPALARTGPERWKRALARRADRVLCYSEATRRDCIEILGLPAAKLRVTPLASRDWRGVAPTPVAGARPPFVLWIGARHAYKNFDAALRAWAACTAARETQLLCLGGAPWSKAERAAIAALGVSGRVQHHVATDGELAWAYQHAFGLFYPSRWEGFGIPVVEAMTLGCPVVISDRSALPEVGGQVALYVDPESHDSLVDGVAALVGTSRDAALAAALAAQAARFSWDRTAALHEAVYRELDP
jgi:glycosyltransferase involved in cell wall biosynthesis